MPDPTSEADLLGAHERFSEQITDSIDLLHRRLKTPLLCKTAQKDPLPFELTPKR